MPQDDYKAIHAIADRLTPQLRREFLTAVDQLQGRIDVRAIASALRRGRIREVELIADAFPKELAPAVETMNTAFRQGGQVSAVQASPRLRETVRFDVTNPEALKAAERNAARLVTNVSRETRKTIREIIAGGFRDQRTVDDMARDIRAHIGLTRGDSRMVTVLRQDLTKAGTPKTLIDAQINQLIARKVQHRAVTIARTETINSANAGQLALWQQMRDDGLLPPEGLFKQWIVTPDDRLCERCGELTDQVQPLDMPFVEPGGGTVMTPALHPRCRCAMGLTTRLPDKDRRRVRRRRVVTGTGLGLVLARTLANPAVRSLTGKTVWQHLGPHILGPRRFVGMALPFVKGAARYDGRIRGWIRLHDEMQDVLKQGHWTPHRASPMWEVGVERPLYTPARPRPVVTFADPVLPTLDIAETTPVTSQLVRTPTLVEGTYHPDELVLFLADRTGLSDFISGIDLHDRLTDLIAAATFNQDTRVIALARDTAMALAGYMHTVRTGEVAGYDLRPTSDFERSFLNPKQDPTFYNALVSVGHELLHAYLWRPGVGYFKMRHWATRFMEEGLVENTARRFVGGLFFGGEWGRMKRAGNAAWLQQFERAIAYKPFVRELRWYEQTFGTEAYYRLMDTPLDVRGEVAVDQIKGWLPTALAEHPKYAIHRPEAVARLVEAIEKADYRAVLRLWQDGTLRELHTLSPVVLATKFSLSTASAKELLKATGAPVTDLSKAAEPLLEQALHELSPPVRNALVVFARLLVAGKELHDLQQAARNLHALWTTAGIAAPKVDALLAVLEIAEALTTAVDTVTGGPLSDPAELIKATHSAAVSATKLLELLRSGAPDLIDTAPVAARLVAAVRKVVGSPVVAEVATAALAYFTPGLTAVQGVIRVVQVAKGAKKIRQQIEAVARDVLALITKKSLRPDDIWDPDMRPVVRRSVRFWSNLQSGWWTPLDRHLGTQPRPLILEGDGALRPVGMTWPTDLTLSSHVLQSIQPRLGALTPYDYDARQLVAMMVDLFELNPKVSDIVLGDATVMAMGARAAFEPASGRLLFHPKLTNRFRWLMAGAHDPGLGGPFVARAEPEHLLDVHTITHELMHARAGTPYSPDPVNELLEEGLTELYARRYSTALFYGRNYGTYAEHRQAEVNEIGAYPNFVHSMRVFERAFGWAPTRALYFAPPAERQVMGAALIRGYVRHVIESGMAHPLYRGDTVQARVARAQLNALLAVQPDRAIVGVFMLPHQLPDRTYVTFLELFTQFEPVRVVHTITDAVRFLPDQDGNPGGNNVPFPVRPIKALPDRPIQPHQRLDTLLVEPTHPTWVEVPFPVLDDLQAGQLAATTNFGGPGTWQTIPLDRVVTTQRTVTRAVVEEKILNAPPVLGTDPPGRRDFGVVRAIAVGDRFYLADGTHQTVAAWARGETTIAAWVVEPKRPLELTPRPASPRPLLDRPVATPEPRPIGDPEKAVFQRVFAEQVNHALGNPLATLDDPLAAIRALREELKTLPVEVAQAIERDAAHVARYAANPLRGLRTFEPPLDDPMPLVDPFHGVPFGDHTPAAQSRLISFLAVTTGEQFRPYGSVAQGKTSTNDIDILVVHPTHGMSVAEQRVWWAGQEQLAHEAEDAVRAAVARGDMTQDQLMAELAGDPPAPAYVGALERLGFSYVSSIPGFPEPDGTLGTVSVARFSRPDTGHTVEVWEHHPEPPRPSAFADEDDGIVGQAAPKITPAQRKAAVAQLAATVRITEVEDVSVHPLLSRMHPEFDSVVSFATQVADVLGVAPRPITLDPHDPRLIATQDGFNSAHVRDLLLHPEDHVREDVPTIIDFGGHLLVQDGHHRLIANKLLGVPVEAEVYDLSHFTLAEVEATIQQLSNRDIERGFARLQAAGAALAEGAPVPTLLATLDRGVLVEKDSEPEVAAFVAVGATEVPGRLYRGLSFQRDALASFLERRMLTTATGQPFATELPVFERNLAAQDLELAASYTRNAVGYGSPGGDYGLLVEIEPTPAMRTAMEGTHDPTQPKGFLGTRRGSGVMQLPAEDVSFDAVTRAWIVRYDWVEATDEEEAFLRSWHIEPVPDAILHPPPQLKFLPDREAPVLPKDARVVRAGAKFAWEPPRLRRVLFNVRNRQILLGRDEADLDTLDDGETHAGIVHDLSRQFEDVSKRDDDYVRGWFTHHPKARLHPQLELEFVAQTRAVQGADADALAILAEEQVVAFVRTAKDRLSLPDDLPVFIEFKTATIPRQTTVGAILNPKVDDDGIVGMARPGGPHDLPTTYLRDGVLTPVPAPEILVNRTAKIIEVNLPDIGMIGVSEPFADFAIQPGFLHVDYIRLDAEAHNQGFGLWLYEEAFRQTVALGLRGIASAHSMRSPFANRAWNGLRRRYQVETLWHGEGPARTPVDYLRSLDRIDQPRPLPLSYVYDPGPQFSTNEAGDLQRDDTPRSERRPMPPVRVEVFGWAGEGDTIADRAAGTHVPGMAVEIKLRGIGHLDLSDRFPSIPGGPRRSVNPRDGYLWVDSALVTEGARGQGIGRWFYEEGLRQALARGYKGIASQHLRSKDADAVWAGLKRRYTVQTEAYADYFTSFEPPDDDGRAVVDRAIARLEDIAKREALGPTHPIYDEAEGDPRHIHMARFVKAVVAKRDPYTLTGILPAAVPERVPIGDLLATQVYVGVDRIRRVLEGEFAGTVSVLRIKGELYLSDGHHRVAAASLKDETHIDALVTTIPDPDLRDASGRDLGGYTGPERRAVPRTEPDLSEDAVFQRMRDKIARGELTGTEAAREAAEMRSRLDAARKDTRRPEATDVVYYHGTNSLKLPAIREQGLVPGEDNGAVAAWAGSVTLTSHSYDHVYLTTDRNKAIEYAEMVTATRGRPAVIAVRIPAEHLARLSPDADDPGGMRFEGTIPPDWFVDPDEDGRVGMRKQTAGADPAPVVTPFGPPPSLLPDPRIRALIHQSEALWTTLRAGTVTGGRDPGPLWAGNGHIDEAVHVQRLLTYLADLQGVPYLDGKAGARGINGFALNSATADDEGFHAFYDWDNKWVSVSSEMTGLLRFFLAQVRDGATSATLAATEPDTLFAIYSVSHELEHARQWVSPRGHSRYVAFLEEGITELHARRYATALLFGRQAATARTLASLADLRARQPYALVTQATRWYERTFGRQGLAALQASDERMTHLQDTIEQWLADTAIAAHPDPLVAAHRTQILDAFRRRHFGATAEVLHARAVVQLWADGFWETFHTKSWTDLAETFTTGVQTVESFGNPMVPLPKKGGPRDPERRLPKLPDAALVVRGRYAYSLRLEHDRRVLFNPDTRTLLLGRAVHLRDLRDDVETHTEVLGEMANRHDDVVDKDDLYIKGLFFAQGSSRIVLAISDAAETRQYQAAAIGSAEAAIIAEAQIVTFVRVLQDRLSLPDTFPVHILTPTATLPKAVYRDGIAIRGETTIGAILHPKVDDGIVGQAAPRPSLPPDGVTVLKGLDKFTLDGVEWRRFLYHPRTGQVIVGPDEHVGKVAEHLRTHVGLLEAAGPDQPPFDEWMRGVVRDRARGAGHRFVIERFGSFRLREDGLEDWEHQVRALARRLDHFFVLPGYTGITTPIVMPGFRDHETALAAWLDDGIVGMARATPDPQTKGEQQTLDWIRMIASQATGTLGEGGFVYRNIEDLLLQHGQFYRPAALTPEEVAYLRTILKGQTFPMQQCYANAQSLLWRTPPEPGMDLRYHEGWTYMGLIPVRHAWLTLNGKVVDLTMRDAGWGSTYDPTGKLKDRAVGTWNPEQRAYFGLELSRDVIVERMQATDEWHTLLDDFERRWPLLRRPYVAPDAPPDPDDSVGMAWRNPTTGEYQLDRAFSEEGTRFVVLSVKQAAWTRMQQTLLGGGTPTLMAYSTLGQAEASLKHTGRHPRETGEPVYLVQIKTAGADFHPWLGAVADAVWDLVKQASSSRIKRVWALYPDGGVFELPTLPKPSKVAIATKPIVDPLMRRAATTLHEDLWSALRDGIDHEGDRLWEGAQHGAIYDADAGLYPERLVAKMVDMFRATEVREIEIDSAYADRQRYLGAWDYRHHKLMLSTSTTNDLRVILRKARAAAELNLRLMPEDFEPLTVVLKALETVVHEIVHALDTTPFVSDRYERWIEEGLTELRSRRIAMGLIFGGQSRHTRNGPGAEAFARGGTDGSYEDVTRAMRWYERTFGTAAIEELWRTGHRVTPMGARLRGLLRTYLTTHHPDLLPLLNVMTNERLVELWGKLFFLRLVPDRPHAGMRPITRFELQGDLRVGTATPGSSRDIPQAQIRPWEPPAPRHVFDPDVRTFMRLRASLVRALNDGRWTVRSEPTLLRGLRYKQPVSVFQYTEIPFWWDEGSTRLRQGGAPRHVEGTYNVAGLIQFMAWHLGVAERLVAIEFSPFITVQGPPPPWSVFTVLPEGSPDVTRRVLHVHTTLQRDLAGFLHVVRHADLHEALTYPTHVVALRDIAAALLALEATPAPVEDRWETFLRIGFTELFVQRWGQAILFGPRAPVPADHRLNRGLDDPGDIFQPLQQPLRWFEQRFGRQAALDIWRGPDRFFRLRDELHRWLLWAFHRHPDPEVSAAAVELFDLVRFGPMGNQGWGELESNAVPLFFRGVWEDLDRGKHGLGWWRDLLRGHGLDPER